MKTIGLIFLALVGVAITVLAFMKGTPIIAVIGIGAVGTGVYGAYRGGRQEPSP